MGCKNYNIWNPGSLSFSITPFYKKNVVKIAGAVNELIRLSKFYCVTIKSVSELYISFAKFRFTFKDTKDLTNK